MPQIPSPNLINLYIPFHLGYCLPQMIHQSFQVFNSISTKRLSDDCGCGLTLDAGTAYYWGVRLLNPNSTIQTCYQMARIILKLLGLWSFLRISYGQIGICPKPKTGFWFRRGLRSRTMRGIRACLSDAWPASRSLLLRSIG